MADKSKRKNTSTSIILLLPIIAIMGVVPFITHEFRYAHHLIDFPWFNIFSDTDVDFAHIWKGIFTLVTAAVIIIILLIQASIREKFAYEKSLFFLAGYLFFVVLSAIASPYRAYAVRWTYGICQPIWVVMAYLIICYYTYNTVKTENDLIRVLHLSGIGTIFVALVSLSQAIGKDFYATGIGKRTMLNPSNWDNMDSLSPLFPKGVVYGVFGNPDYVGYYWGIVIPLVIALFFTTKKIWLRVSYVVILGIAVMSLIMAGTISAFAGPVIAIIFGCLIYISRTKKGLIISIAGAALLIAVALVATLNVPTIKKAVIGTTHDSDNYDITKIDAGDTSVDFYLANGNVLSVAYDIEGFFESFDIYIKDAQGNDLSYTTTEINGSTAYVVDDSASYGAATICPTVMGDENGYKGISVELYDMKWGFTKDVKNTYLYYNAQGKLDKIPDVKVSSLFYDDAFSDRGIIWNTTIPQLKKYIFKGVGAGNYLLSRPQNNYIRNVHLDKAGAAGIIQIETKAHSFYLGQWVENGLLGLICLLIFYIMYIINSVKIYRSADFSSATTKIGFALMIGISGYLITNLVNDSIASVAPIFWVTMGLGMAVNKINKEALDHEV